MIIFFCFLHHAIYNSIALEHVFELEFETYPSFYLLNGSIVVHEENNLLIYHEDKIIKRIILKQGEGPGELAYIHSINGIVGDKDLICLWDALGRRMLQYTPDWNYQGFLKLPEIRGGFVTN